MLFPISQMVEGREPPLCAAQDLQVRQAMKIMLKNDFSQLPVVDADGYFVGMISQAVVANTYFLLDGEVQVLDLTLDHCVEQVDPLTPDDDLFEACDRVRRGEYAVVVVQDRKPVGIFTANDLTEFFRRRSEDFLKIEDIEITLRLRTRDAFPDDEAMNEAIMNALGPNPDDPKMARKAFTDLSLGELVQVMIASNNWPKFNGMFAPIGLFNSLMGNIRQVRNQLAHFHGNADPVQNMALKYARDWLSTRAAAARYLNSPARQVRPEQADLPAQGTIEDPWRALEDWLKKQEKTPDGIKVSLRDLDMVMGGKLPKGARKYTSWWSNTHPENPQCAAWIAAGWKIVHPNLVTQEVILMPVMEADGKKEEPVEVEGSQESKSNNGHKAGGKVAAIPETDR